MVRNRSRSTVSEPSKGVRRVFSVVDLLVPGTRLPDVIAIFESLRNEDPDGLLENFKFESGPNWIEQNSGKIFAPLEKTIKRVERITEVYGFYRLKALERCLVDLPSDFIDYVDLPRSDPEWLYDSLVRNHNYNETYGTFLSMVDQSPGGLEGIKFGKPTDDAVQRYRQADNWFRRLYELAMYLEGYIEGYLEEYPAKFRRLPTQSSSMGNVTVVDNRVEFEADVFNEAFRGAPIVRIKLCKNCDRVFWAKRADMKGCSGPCARILRTRKWREKITPEQKQKYKITRLYKG